jgi:polysaccharide deacetylase 2 family uncharacterized protein YibQ
MTCRHAIAAAALAAALVLTGHAAAEPNASRVVPAPVECGAPSLSAVGLDACERQDPLTALPRPAERRPASLPASPVVPRVAIIIDDLGYHAAAGRRAIDLPGAVSVAILPGTPHSHRLAQAANERGRDILLHLPMQAYGDESSADTLNLTLDMSRARLVETVDAAFDLVPFAIGLNNHRGSLVTRHPGHMQWLMETLAERDSLIFVDSYTTHESVALEVAAETGIDAVKRDVFLDADPSPHAIRMQLDRLVRIASKRGAAVAIAHPYPETLATLERELPGLPERGVQLVPISELVSNSGRVADSKTQ